jgi:hypothetical protein
VKLIYLLQVQSVFGVRGRKVEVYSDANIQTPLSSSGNISNLNTKTLYVDACTGEQCGKQPVGSLTSPVCHFTNIEYTDAGGKNCRGTLLLENPRGDTCTMSQLQSQVNKIH